MPFVAKVTLSGDAFVRESTAQAVAAPILQSTDIPTVLRSSQEAIQKLNALGISKSCTIHLDTDEQDNVTVDLRLEPASFLSGSINTSTSHDSADLSSSLSLKNMFGGGEKFKMQLSHGKSIQDYFDTPTPFDSDKSYEASLDIPIQNDPYTRLILSTCSSTKDFMNLNSHKQMISFIGSKVSLLDRISGIHEFEYMASWRHNHSISKDASWSIRRNAGDSLKSSVSHTWTLDSRDDGSIPTTGSYFNTFSEFAGIGGTVHHVKAEAQAQKAVPLGWGFVLNSTFRTGFIAPLFSRPTSVNDRFFLGGPSSLRGFLQNRVGPCDKNDHVGGDLMYNTGISLFTPLPYFTNGPIKGHFFLNGGSLVSLENTLFKRAVYDLIDRSSVSVGTGLAIKFSFIRLELNYVLPILANIGDGFKQGIQFGVGIHFG